MSNRIGLLGPFGYGNLGDAAIQEAMIHRIRQYDSGTEICGFSLNPRDTEERHGIRAYPITRRFDPVDSRLQKIVRRVPGNGASRLITFVFCKAPREIQLIGRSFRILKGFDLIIVSGGGQLEDYWGGAFGHPLTLFLWALLARIRGAKFTVVSVGAGPIRSALSRFLIRRALSLASYRSYRDESSKQLLRRIGFKNDDPVYPDLAYSLPTSRSPVHISRPPRMVGVGPMSYFDPRVWPEKDGVIYTNYLRKMLQFVRWLTQEAGFTVVLFPGETVQDGRAICDLKNMLAEEDGGIPRGQILQPQIETVATLVEQLKKTDLVVASRLHSVILSHVLLKPVLAISYHEKIDVLMADLNQSSLCLNIDDFEAPALVERFKVMESELESLRAAIRKQTQTYRRALDRQYETLFREKSPDCSN